MLCRSDTPSPCSSVAWFTAWAIAPHRPRASRPSAPSFWFSFAVNELPFPALAWLVVVTLMTAIDGSLDSPGAYAVAAVAAFTAGGLAVIARRGWKAETEVRRALHDQGIAPPDRSRDGAGRPSRVRLILWPFSVRPRGVRRIKDVAYGESDPATRLDLYLPRPRTSAAPILVFFHGRRIPRWQQVPGGQAAALPSGGIRVALCQCGLRAGAAGVLRRRTRRRSPSGRLGPAARRDVRSRSRACLPRGRLRRRSPGRCPRVWPVRPHDRRAVGAGCARCGDSLRVLRTGPQS